MVSSLLFTFEWVGEKFLLVVAFPIWRMVSLVGSLVGLNDDFICYRIYLCSVYLNI